jgi:hypothetical protein
LRCRSLALLLILTGQAKDTHPGRKGHAQEDFRKSVGHLVPPADFSVKIEL